jgi:hypothetical protein
MVQIFDLIYLWFIDKAARVVQSTEPQLFVLRYLIRVQQMGETIGNMNLG